MRPLQTHDIFMTMRVVNKIGVREEFLKIADQVKSDKGLSVSDIGYSLIFGLIEKAGTAGAENAVYELLSGPLETPAAELKVMDPLDFIDKVEEFIKSIDKERWQAFFKRVSDMIR